MDRTRKLEIVTAHIHNGYQKAKGVPSQMLMWHLLSQKHGKKGVNLYTKLPLFCQVGS